MKDDTIYRLIKFFTRLIGWIPRPIARGISDFLGRIWFKADKRHRLIVQENISHAFGLSMDDPGVRNMAREIFKNIAGILFEIGWAYNLKRSEFPRYFTFKGYENLEAALKKRKGALVLTCHLGNWELLCQAVSQLGLENAILYRKLDFQPLERFLLEIREQFGTRLIALKGASRKVDALLARGHIVGTLLDQNVDWHEGCFVNFFGRPACTNDGVASLILRTKAPVVPMFIVREGQKYLIEFLPEVPLVLTNDRIKDLEINTQNYTSAIETMIRRCPAQWFWVHNRWKTKNSCPWPKAA
ncbi:lysophospholipid acyltransferase family protein [Desulfospira joergensenii]|uniref:lysophospholipid acyltransferase family protein n=1 Tax=Desulfospira joergensenii TaxID=53329 RepID=UPI0003B5AB5F|nr:lysophospholipid acyltransferase family protein [Desulfospira joergensenii]